MGVQRESSKPVDRIFSFGALRSHLPAAEQGELLMLYACESERIKRHSHSTNI